MEAGIRRDSSRVEPGIPQSEAKRISELVEKAPHALRQYERTARRHLWRKRQVQRRGNNLAEPLLAAARADEEPLEELCAAKQAFLGVLRAERELRGRHPESYTRLRLKALERIEREFQHLDSPEDRRHLSILILYVRRLPHPGATRAPRNLIVHASWRALSGHTARETIYHKMGLLHARVGRAPPRRTYSTSISLCAPEEVLSAAVMARALLGGHRVGGRLLAWYASVLRVRLAFFLSVVLALLLSVFSGSLMEVFFASFVGDSLAGDAADEKSRPLELIVGVWVLPIVLNLLALLGDEICDLVVDAYGNPPLAWLMASVLAAVSQSSTRPPARLMCKVVDRVFLFSGDGVPLLYALRARSLGGSSFMGGYVEGSLLSAVVLAVSALLADAMVAADSVGKSQRYGEAHIAFQHVHLAIEVHKIYPGTLEASCEYLGHYFEDCPAEVSSCVSVRRGVWGWAVKKLEWASFRARELRTRVVKKRRQLSKHGLALLLWSIAAGLSVYQYLPAWITGCAMLVSVVHWSGLICWYLPQLAGPPFYLVLVFFTLVSLCALSGGGME
ncbi:unnamed protein product, partial [Prorocentrum cordatum]